MKNNALNEHINIEKKIIDLLPEFIILLKPDGEILQINKGMTRSLTGKNINLIGKKVLDYFPKEVAKHRIKMNEIAIKAKKPVSFIDKRDDRWFEQTFTPIFDSNGKLIQILATVKDVTKRELSGKNLQELLDNMHEGVFTFDKNGRFTFVNEIIEKRSGLTKDKFYKLNVLDIILPEYKEIAKKNFDELIDGDEIKPFIVGYMGTNRKKIYVEIRGRPLYQKGKVIGGQCLSIDITDKLKTDNRLKHAQIELEGQKDYLQNIINSASEIIVTIDSNNRVTTWNKTTEIITGYKQKEVLGMKISHLDVFVNSDNLEGYITNVFNEHSRPFEDVTLQSTTGVRKLVRMSGSIIKGDNKENIGVLLVGGDITLDSEMHGKLIPGNSYVCIDKNTESPLSLFKDLIVSGYDGLYVTRSNPERIKDMFPSLDVEVILLSKDKTRDFEYDGDIDGLVANIKRFVEEKPRPLILIDRVDYLISIFSFEEFIKALYRINNILAGHNAVLLWRVNPYSVDKIQLEIIKEELLPLPSQKIEDIELEDKLYEILKFIHKQTQNNMLVSYSKIGHEFSITKVTTGKYLNSLGEKGLVFIEKKGKSKSLHVTEKGKTILQRRKII